MEKEGREVVLLSKTIVTVFLCCWITVYSAVQAKCQETRLKSIPLQVSKAFATKYNRGTDAEWFRNDELYKVSFVQDEIYYFAWFTPNGKWLRSEYTIEPDDLPPVVKATLKKSQYANWQTGNANVFLYPDKAPQYQLFVYDNDWNELELFFDSEGKLLTQ
jgi:hypothetical protein